MPEKTYNEKSRRDPKELMTIGFLPAKEFSVRIHRGERRPPMLSDLIALIFQHVLYLALHIDNTHSFPKPLSAKEEKECFARMEAGDSEARNKLIEHNLRLVAHIIKKYFSSTSEQDDLISIGTIGLIKAVGTFNYSKGTRFATYASRCIENEILMHFRNLKKTASDVYINDTIDTDKDGNSLSLIDIIADDVSIMDNIDLKFKSEQLYHFINTYLSNRDRMIITMRYGLGGSRPMTQRAIAEKLNISRSYVSRIEKKALEKLKKRFESGEQIPRQSNKQREKS